MWTGACVLRASVPNASVIGWARAQCEKSVKSELAGTSNLASDLVPSFEAALHASTATRLHIARVGIVIGACDLQSNSGGVCRDPDLLRTCQVLAGLAALSYHNYYFIDKITMFTLLLGVFLGNRDYPRIITMPGCIKGAQLRPVGSQSVHGKVDLEQVAEAIGVTTIPNHPVNGKVLLVARSLQVKTRESKSGERL